MVISGELVGKVGIDTMEAGGDLLEIMEATAIGGAQRPYVKKVCRRRKHSESHSM